MPTRNERRVAAKAKKAAEAEQVADALAAEGVPEAAVEAAVEAVLDGAATETGEAAAIAAEAVDAAAAEPEQERSAPVVTLVWVNPTSPFEKGSNRQAWYDYVAGMVGKTRKEIMADAEARAKRGEAVSYHKRGRKAGLAEDTAEWLDWLAMPKQNVLRMAKR